MNKIYLFLLIIAIALATGECGSRKKRKRGHRRMQTTTTPAPVEPIAEEEEEEKDDDNEWVGACPKENPTCKVDADLAISFFDDFDEDNIVDNDEEPPYINKPEVIDFFAKFPATPEELTDEFYFNEVVPPKYAEEKEVKQEQVQDGKVNQRLSGLYVRRYGHGDDINGQGKLGFLTGWRRLGFRREVIIWVKQGKTSTEADLEFWHWLGPHDQIIVKQTVDLTTHDWADNCMDPNPHQNQKYNLKGETGRVCSRSLGYKLSSVNGEVTTKTCIETMLISHYNGLVFCFGFKHKRHQFAPAVYVDATSEFVMLKDEIDNPDSWETTLYKEMREGRNPLAWYTVPWPNID